MSGVLIKVRLSARDKIIDEWMNMQSLHGQSYSKIIDLALTYHSLTNEYPQLGNVSTTLGDGEPGAKNIYLSADSRALKWLEYRQSHGEKKSSVIKRVLGRCISCDEDAPQTTITLDELMDMLVEAESRIDPYNDRATAQTSENHESPAISIKEDAVPLTESTKAPEESKDKEQRKNAEKAKRKSKKTNPLVDSFMTQGFGFGEG